MKLYPYSKVKTENLFTLLLASRFVGVIGYLAIVVAIGLLIFSIFAGPQIILGDPNSPIISMSTPGYREVVLSLSLASFISGSICLILSGLCAAVVSCEHKYTMVK
jgi:hypothetical protein